MQIFTRGRMRTAASALTAGALAAAALTFAGSPAQADESPSVEAAVSFDAGIDVTVDGVDFDPASRQDAMGVYVAIAEKQDITGAGMDTFFASDWVMPGQITDGAFTKELSVDPVDVEAGKEYAIYTWTAHGSPAAGDTQYTETDVVLTAAPVEVANPSVSATAEVDGTYVDLAIDGANFNPASRPGAMGVYVALSEKRDIFDDQSDDQASGMENFVASDWVLPGQISDGSFTKSLTVEKSKLAKGKKYAIYTWTAHGNPTAGDTQYTETLVSIPGLPKNASKVALKLAKLPTSKKKGKGTVTVQGVQGVKAAGKVTVTLKKAKQTKKVSGKLNKRGKVTVKLPKLTKGTWKVTTKYAGNKVYKAAKKVVKIKVKK